MRSDNLKVSHHENHHVVSSTSLLGPELTTVFAAAMLGATGHSIANLTRLSETAVPINARE